MFGLYTNRMRDQQIDLLNEVFKKQNMVICDLITDIDGKFTNFDERLKKIELLLNEPSGSNQQIVESITTTKAVLKVLKKQENELSINCIFDMIKRYNLKNPDVTKGSLRALLYGLRREGRIDYGEEPGTFKSVPGISC
jgi:hypothetical protein